MAASIYELRQYFHSIDASSIIASSHKNAAAGEAMSLLRDFVELADTPGEWDVQTGYIAKGQGKVSRSRFSATFGLSDDRLSRLRIVDMGRPVDWDYAGSSGANLAFVEVKLEIPDLCGMVMRHVALSPILAGRLEVAFDVTRSNPDLEWISVDRRVDGRIYDVCRRQYENGEFIGRGDVLLFRLKPALEAVRKIG